MKPNYKIDIDTEKAKFRNKLSEFVQCLKSHVSTNSN